jgi:hypothetical protein
LRAESSGYFTKSADEIFTQQAVRRIHEQMDPKGVLLRECRDSQAHPNTFPVVLTLDVTGSMGMIPQQLIQDGLPTLMSKLIQSVTAIPCRSASSKAGMRNWICGSPAPTWKKAVAATAAKATCWPTILRLTTRRPILL